jgi:hypothetical protein
VVEFGIQEAQRLVERLRNGENGAMREFYSLYADLLTGKPLLHKLKRHFYLFASDLIRIFVPHSVTSAKTYGSIVSQS